MPSPILDLFHTARLFLRALALFLVCMVLLPSSASADCQDGDMTCQATSVGDSGTTISQTFDLGFATEGQSIWAPGQSSANLGVTLVDPNATAWGGSTKHGSITRYCLDDVFNSVFGNTIAGLFKDYFSNPCYEFGAKVEASLSGDIGFSMDVIATEGEVAIDYPVQVSVDYPSDTTFGPGDDVEIRTSLVVGSAEINAISPHTSIVPTLSASIKGRGYAKGCIDYCSSTTAYDIDESHTNTVEIPLQGPGTRLELNPLLSNTSSPSQVFGFALGATGHIGSPLTTTTINELDQDTLTLVAKGQDDFVDLLIDVDAWLLRFAGVPVNVVGGYTFDAYGAKIGWGVLNAGVNIDATLTQQNTFTPTFFIDFSLSHGVDYDVLDGGNMVSSGSGSSLTIEAGQTVILHIPADHRGEISVSSTVRQSNQFRTTFRQQQDSSLDINALSASLRTPKATIFNSRCLPDYLGGYCTPKWTWHSTSFDSPPVVDLPNLAPVSTEYFVYDPQPWELQGFQSFQLSAFNLVPNTPPEITVPEVIIVEADTLGGTTPDNQSIVDFLQSATAIDFEDGVLSISHTALPALLEVGQSYTVTFSAVDSYNQPVEGTSSITVVDTLPPVLALDNLTVVAEGPLGTPIPDDSNVVSNWLAGLVVVDIADGAPSVTDNTPTFLDLGTTNIGFVATDFSGNQAGINPTVYVKAPFSLFAENSIVIGKKSVVESGMVVVPAVTTGPWLSKEAQVELDKYTVLEPEAPLYSDSISLERSSVVSSAFFNQLSGRGAVNTSGAYLPGIYFPLNAMPGFEIGTEDVIVGCENNAGNSAKSEKSGKSEKSAKSKKNNNKPGQVIQCVESGLVLGAGMYKDLKLNKGRQGESTMVYLSGGTYSFNSIELDGDTQLIALAPSLILVADYLQTDQGASIQSASSQEAELVVMVGGVDKVNQSHDDEDRRDKLKIKQYAVSFDRENNIEATIFAPNGSIEVGKRSLITGALVGENLDIGEEVTIRFDGDI